MPGVPKGHYYARFHTFLFSSLIIDPKYFRSGNPNRDVLEANLAALEGAKFCSVFSSGLSATSAISHMLGIGDCVLSSSDGTGCIY